MPSIGDEHSALLQTSKDRPQAHLKIAIGGGTDEGPANCTPREGLDEVSAKMLNSQIASSEERPAGPIWYRDKQVSRQ